MIPVPDRGDRIMSNTLTAEQHAQNLEGYIQAGVARAAEIGNRGPARFDNTGHLLPEILDSYWQHGFYIFEDVIERGEVDVLRSDIDFLLTHAPVSKDSDVDAEGRPACARPCLQGCDCMGTRAC